MQVAGTEMMRKRERGRERSYLNFVSKSSGGSRRPWVKWHVARTLDLNGLDQFPHSGLAIGILPRAVRRLLQSSPRPATWGAPTFDCRALFDHYRTLLAAVVRWLTSNHHDEDDYLFECDPRNYETGSCAPTTTSATPAKLCDAIWSRNDRLDN